LILYRIKAMKFYCYIFILFFFPNFLFSQNKEIKNLVFEGAGIRGLAYAGALKTFEVENILPQVEKVGGTSAGAITAMMISLGYNSQEVEGILSQTKFHKFNDGKFFFFGGIHRMRKNYGWYRGKKFSKWIENLIVQKTNNKEITFLELDSQGYKDLYVVGTCLNRQKMIVFSRETYPNMKIKDAIRISMSIPLYFQAVFIDKEGNVYSKPKKDQQLDIVVDGGIIGNFPIDIFDTIKKDHQGNEIRIPNPHTLGIRIESGEQIEHDNISKELMPLEINNLRDYINAFYIFTLENLNRNNLTEADWERSISISSGDIGPKIKRLSKQQKGTLLKNGEGFTKSYFHKDF